MHVRDVLADLVAEQQALDDVVAALAADQWSRATPSPRWDVADQIAHLTYFDENAALAIVDPDTFQDSVTALLNASARGAEAADELTMGEFRALPPERQLDRWRAGRSTLADAAATLTDDSRVQWYGPSMGSKSFLTARLMECWAHGQDIVDTVGGARPATDRLRHIAQLGVITRGWSYVNRGLDVPDGDVLVELTGPSGATWTWGAGADHSVRGPAEDFCLVVTQRRNLADTDLEVAGSVAIDWLERAQAFAGPPTDGPAARAA